MKVKERPACEIASPQHIPHNLSVVQRDPESIPRYRLYNTSGRADWEIVDRDALLRRGNHGSRSTFRSKDRWSPEDIFTFVKHLNSRQ